MTSPAKVAASVLLASVRAVPPVPRPSVRLVEAGEVTVGVEVDPVTVIVVNVGSVALLRKKSSVAFITTAYASSEPG